MFRTEIFNRLQVNRKLATGRHDGMKSKARFFSLILLICLHQTRLALPGFVDETEVESFVIERKISYNYEYFTVNMKPNHSCTNDHFNWCISVQATLVAQACSCKCWPPGYVFIAPAKKCIGPPEAEAFGGCSEYFGALNLLKSQPVDLNKKKGKEEFSVSNVRGCSLIGQYYYDYSGFHSRWQSFSAFFELEGKMDWTKIEIKWTKSETSGLLSGRIIRLNISCTDRRTSSLAERCILLRALGTVTHYSHSSSSAASANPSKSYQDVSSTPVESRIPLLSATSTPLSSLSPTSWEVLSTLSVSSSSSRQSSSSMQNPPASVISPSPSSRLFSNIGTPGVVQSILFLPSSMQIGSTKLPEVTSGQMQTTVRTKDQSLSPVKSEGSTNNKEITASLHHSTLVPPMKTSKPTTTSSSSTDGIAPADTGARRNEKNSGTIIGAAVGGAVVLAVLLIVIIIVWRRRKAWKSKDKEANPEKTNKHMKNPVYGSSENEIQLDERKQSKTKPSIAQEDQPMYQGLIFGDGQNNGAAACSSAEDDYDNCTVYQDLDKQIPETPVYLGLSKGLPEGAPTTEIPNSRHSTMPDPKLKPSAGGIPSSKANGTIGVLKSKSATERPKRGPIIAQEPVYNVLDGPGTGPRTTTEPLYNVLEGHEYATPNVDSLYNVLEGPDSSQSVPKSGPNTTEEAVYNVLEGPDTTNGPTTKQGPENDAIYNVLEAPDSDKNSLVSQGRSGPGNEPLYSVLEEQVGEGSKQNAPNKSSSIGGVANPAYEQTLDFGASYAAVNRPGARGDSLYEPLRRPGQDVYEPLG